MANIQRRKHKTCTTYRVTVQRKGFGKEYRSFPTLTDAKKWARTMESKYDKGDTSDYSLASKILMGDLFKRYIKEGKHLKKKQAQNEVYRCNALLKDEISSVNLLRFSTKHLVDYRNRRLEDVQGPTFNKDFNLISVVVTTAIIDW